VTSSGHISGSPEAGAAVVGTGSTALAGSGVTTPGDFDLAAALGDMLTATATGGSGLVDILP